MRLILSFAALLVLALNVYAYDNKTVFSDEAVYDKAAGFTKEWNINGEKVTLGVEKL